MIIPQKTFFLVFWLLSTLSLTACSFSQQEKNSSSLILTQENLKEDQKWTTRASKSSEYMTFIPFAIGAGEERKLAYEEDFFSLIWKIEDDFLKSKIVHHRISDEKQKWKLLQELDKESLKLEEVNVESGALIPKGKKHLFLDGKSYRLGDFYIKLCWASYWLGESCSFEGKDFWWLLLLKKGDDKRYSILDLSLINNPFWISALLIQWGNLVVAIRSANWLDSSASLYRFSMKDAYADREETHGWEYFSCRSLQFLGKTLATVLEGDLNRIREEAPGETRTIIIGWEAFTLSGYIESDARFFELHWNEEPIEACFDELISRRS